MLYNPFEGQIRNLAKRAPAIVCDRGMRGIYENEKVGFQGD
jgi:hypothetical protein